MEMRLDFPGIQTPLTDEEIDRIPEIIRSAKSLSQGPHLARFEEDFSAFQDGHGAAVGLSSATAALELAALLSGIEEGDEVILPAHTFAATALPFLRRKARIIFADIHPKTWVMDVEDVAKKITAKTKVLVPVHLYGCMVDMESLMVLARENSLKVIEDCAQAQGSRFKGTRAGNFGDFGCFSFHSQKNMTTLGEGGMLTFKDSSLLPIAKNLRKIGNQPFQNQEKYWVPAMSNIAEAVSGELPNNYAMGEIQAAVGSMVLSRVDDINQRRKGFATVLEEGLRGVEALKFQVIPDDCLSSFHQNPLRVCGRTGLRDDIIERMLETHGVKCVVQYCPLYRYDLFNQNGYKDTGRCPETNAFFDNMLSIPFHSNMEKEELALLVSALKDSAETLS
jgi:perosamine synthetase